MERTMELRKRKRGTEDVGGSEEAVEFRGQIFQKPGDVIAYLQAVEDDKDRYSAQIEVLEKMVTYHNHAGDMIEEVYTYIERDGAFNAAISHKEFSDTWREVRIIVENNKERRDRVQESSRAIVGCWDEKVVGWLVAVQTSGSFMRAVQLLAGMCSAQEGALRVNRAMVDRLGAPRKGISSQNVIQTADVVAARSLATFERVTRDEQKRFGLRVGEVGFLEEGEVQEEIEGASESVQHFPAPGWEMGNDQASESVQHFPAPGWEMGNDQASDRGDLTRATDLEDDYHVEIRDEMIDEELLSEVGRELQELEKKESSAEAGSGSDEEGTRRRKTTESKCGCSGDVTSGWKTAASKGKSYDMGLNLKLLKAWSGFRKVCYVHSKAMGGHVGLRVKQLNGQQLEERLRYIHNNRLEIGRLKTSKDTFSWFRVKNRPARASDTLGPYKFKHEDLLADLDYDQQTVLDWIGGVDTAAWNEEGSVNINLFGWWFETEIGNIVLREFDAYRHHLREINGKSNYGWLRNMFYSIGQQLMRQDPVYYATYAALRPDKQWRLVSYPYYAKYAVKGDNTYFRHMDLNIPELLANARGCNMIQGSISLDNEDNSNCTVILPGMQYKLGQWWERVVERGQETDGFVHRITEQMFTREDAKVLGLDWKRVPCSRGEARITMPHLPHGADGPSTGTRRTMLPWLVGLQDDLTTLEVVEGGTWEMLSNAHRDMASPSATPSGLANRYGAIPYKFPAAVEITGLGPLSDALVCRRRWDSALVLRDRDILLSGSREEASKYVKAWREKAVAAAIEAFALVVQKEKQAFGEKSYYFHLDRLERFGLVFPEVEPDEEDEVEEGESKEGGADFAEAAMGEVEEGQHFM